MMLYGSEGDAKVDYRAVLPFQRTFNTVDGTTGHALGAWVSRTGWTTSSDTLAFMQAYALGYTNDHVGTGGPGGLKLFRNGWMLVENGAKDTGVGVDTNMMLFGGACQPPRHSAHLHRQVIQRCTTNKYSFIRLNAQPAYNTTAKATRALRYVAHMKASGAADYVVVYDDLASSAGVTKSENLYFEKLTAGSTMTSTTSPNFVWTGSTNRLLTSVLYPTGSSLFAASSTLTNSFKTAICASLDGATCDTNNTAAEFITVHKPSTNTSDTMPTLTLLSSDAGYRVVQIADATTPKVVAFPKAGATASSVAFTTTHSGTAQVLITGITPGTYDIKRAGLPSVHRRRLEPMARPTARCSVGLSRW